jgi:hypothetical protein
MRVATSPAAPLFAAQQKPVPPVRPAAVKFGDLIGSEKKGDGGLSAKDFLKSGLLLTAGNSAWLAILLGLQALPALNPNQPHHEPAAIVREAPLPHADADTFTLGGLPAAEAHDDDHDHEEEDHAHQAPATAKAQDRERHGHGHATGRGVRDVDHDNFARSLWEHMPLETANDTVRGVAVTGIIGLALWIRERFRRRRKDGENGAQPAADKT